MRCVVGGLGASAEDDDDQTFARIYVKALTKDPQRLKSTHMHRVGLRRNPPHEAVIHRLPTDAVRHPCFTKPSIWNNRPAIESAVVYRDQPKAAVIAQRCPNAGTGQYHPIGAIHPPGRILLHASLGPDFLREIVR